MVYICRFCDAFVGVHKSDPTKSKGSVANRSLREYRKQAHESFDIIWRNKHMERSEAYKWLSIQMGIEREYTHIGMFDENQCKQVIGIAGKYLLFGK